MTLKIGLLGTLIALLAIGSAAQEVTGNISGTVRDSSGAVVPGAGITITNSDKGAVVRELKTQENGEYSAGFLPIGHYDLTAQAAGFKTTTRTKIEVNVNDKLRIDFTLQPGVANEVVNVEAEPIQVQLQDATAAGLISGTQVRELAINNRIYVQLVALMPGVSSGLGDEVYPGAANPSGFSNQINLSVNGSRPTQNNFSIDGADNFDRGANLTLLNYPSVDSIAEFKVLRGEYGAEFGRSSSGQINVITRSGTNQFHGGIYEFFRNDVLAANEFFNKRNGVKRQPLRYNNFGGTFGGPIFLPGGDRNKTFFFFSEEVRRIITYSSFTSGEVPTAAEQAGTFPTPVCLNPACTVTGMQVTNINPVAAAYVKDIFSKLPLSQLRAGNTLFTPGRNTFNTRQESIKIDHVFSPRLSVFGRFTNDSIPTVEPGGLFTGSALPAVATTSTNSPAKSFAARVVASLTPSLVNEAGYAYSWGGITSTPTGLDSSLKSPDIKPTLPFPSQLPRVPDLSFSDGQGIFGFGPYRDFNRNHNFFDNLTKVSGRHNMKFGASYNRYQKSENAAGGGSNNGSYGFNDVDPTGAGTFQQEFANFLQGFVSSFTQANVDFQAEVRQQQFEAYAQDEFRIRPNLTLSYGVRYSYFRQPTDALGRATSFDPSLYNPATAPAIDPATGLLVAGTVTPILNGVIVGGKNSPFGGSVARTPKLDFAPRIGIAWDPFRDGKYSIRSGYGIFFDSPAVNSLEQFQFSNPPFVRQITISNTSLDNPASGTPDINLIPSALGGPSAKWRQPYTQQWSFDVQHEFAPGLIFDLGYYGSKGTHLIGVVDINEPRPGAYLALGIKPPINFGNTQRLNAVRPYKGYDGINIFSTVFGSNYHSLQTQLQKRFSGNSVVVFNYTWSRAMTDSQSDYRTPQNTYDIRAEYGRAQFDRRHVFTGSYIYELPFFKDQQGFLGHLLGGYEFSGITTINSGLPLTVTGGRGVDPAGLGLLSNGSFAGRRPDQIGDPNANAPHMISKWFNTSAYANIPKGVVRAGTSRRGAVNGPGLQRWDMSLFKNNKITERVTLQFRAEAFNVFNHTNFDSIRTSLSSRTFGRVLSARSSRKLQLGLKLNF